MWLKRINKGNNGILKINVVVLEHYIYPIGLVQLIQ